MDPQLRCARGQYRHRGSEILDQRSKSLVALTAALGAKHAEALIAAG
jgi:hypothetical protein